MKFRAHINYFVHSGRFRDEYLYPRYPPRIHILKSEKTQTHT